MSSADSPQRSQCSGVFTRIWLNSVLRSSALHAAR
ncbi:Uncharacterised protein [Bordetella pertussis]|nr:Uncharacterised protein [Bordetella pertussis]